MGDIKGDNVRTQHVEHAQDIALPVQHDRLQSDLLQSRHRHLGNVRESQYNTEQGQLPEPGQRSDDPHDGAELDGGVGLPDLVKLPRGGRPDADFEVAHGG